MRLIRLINNWWECPFCGTLYRFKKDALECCKVTAHKKETSHDDKQDRKRTGRSDRRRRAGQTAAHRIYQAEGIWKGSLGGNTEADRSAGQIDQGAVAKAYVVVVVDGEKMKNWLRDNFFAVCVIAGVVTIVWQFMLAMGE